MKRNRSSTPPGLPNSEATGKIYRSASIEDRASSFTAFYSPTLPLSALQNHAFFNSANHRIAAWRKPSRQRTVLPGAPPLYDTGYDDDGESYAGKRIGRVIEIENVEGAVVVGRWYGGVLLGPVRFQHIEAVAREAIRKYKDDSHSVKKSRLGPEDIREQKRLVQELQNRDQNIAILRSLLEEKKQQQQSVTQTPSTAASASSPSKNFDYSNMPLTRLKQLDKARDATVSWLLKQIEQVERMQADLKANSYDRGHDGVAKSP